MSDERAELVSAWATGVGVGLIALMVTWLVGNRLAALVWAPPVGPTVAFSSAIVVGIATSFLAGLRLVGVVRRERAASKS